MSTSMPYQFQANNTPSTQPPTMHWAIVLGLDVITLSLFGYYWAYRQAAFIKKVDAANPKANVPVLEVLASLALALFSGLMGVMTTMTVARGGEATNLGGVMNICHLFQFVFFTVASVLVQKSLVARYGVKMNLLLTIFFNIFYVQYHMTRIAKLQLPLLPPVGVSQQVSGHAAPTQS